MIRKIETPDISKIKNERLSELFSNEKVQRLVQKSFAPYLHWEKIKHWPAPDGVEPIEVWATIKLIRNKVLHRRETVVKDEKGKPFSWISYLPGLEEFLHQIDMKLGGNLFVAGNQVGDEMKHRLLSRGVMEEAIASSQLEGAHTSRKAAKQMILEGKKPKNRDEQMIVNNYQAMLLIENELKDKRIDEEIFLDLHRVFTAKTLEEADVGRFRRNEDDVIVGDTKMKNEIYHIPPKEEFVKEEIKRLIAFANGDIEDVGFVHPVIKAIILHFWIGYLHPFVDGNGRMARALFYWSLLREKYWAFSFLPISKVLKESPAQYSNAFIYSEQDDNDLTYFIDFNIRKITQAMLEFEAYAQRKWKENTKMAKIAREKYELNNRQIQLLRYYFKNKDATTSATTHMRIYETSRITAMKDLRELLEQGFVTSKKVGRVVYYFATDKVSTLFD